MGRRNVTSAAKAAALVCIATMLIAAAACNVHKSKSGENEKVDIQTPLGNIKVNTDADVKDTGLALYPGAQPKKQEGHGEHGRANVNISGGLFGVKVVALEYVSDDSPEKLKDFYKKELGKYGDVIECKGGINENHGPDGSQIRCQDNPSHPDRTEMVVGTKERQHIVAVKPNGKGTEFGLVYVQTRGKEGAL